MTIPHGLTHRLRFASKALVPTASLIVGFLILLVAGSFNRLLPPAPVVSQSARVDASDRLRARLLETWRRKQEVPAPNMYLELPVYPPLRFGSAHESDGPPILIEVW